MFSFQNFTGTQDHRRELAYFNLRWTLRLHREHLNGVFQMARDLSNNLAEIVRASYDPNGPWGAVGELNMGPGAVFAAALQSVDGDRGAYGGLIAVELRTITKRFRDEFRPDDATWAALPTLGCGYTIFEVIRATSNNFRHYDDWRATVPLKDEQKRDMRVLAALRNMQGVPEANWNLAFGTNMVWLCLVELGRTYGEIERLVVDGAEALLANSGTPASPGISTARTF